MNVVGVIVLACNAAMAGSWCIMYVDEGHVVQT
jgi:hypothetical protein